MVRVAAAAAVARLSFLNILELLSRRRTDRRDEEVMEAGG
jgi:hypothetical protein